MRNSVGNGPSLSALARERRDSSASTSSSGSGGGHNSSTVLPINRIFTVCDIVKAGHLHIKRPPTGGSVKIRLKTWQKRYLVLRDQSYQRGTVRLEIYNTDTGWQLEEGPENNSSSSDCFSVDLLTVTHVDTYTESKNHPHAFTITRRGHGPLILAADCDYDLKEWIVAIQLLADKLKTDDCSEGANNNNVKADNTSPTRRPSCPPRLAHWGSAQQLLPPAPAQQESTTGAEESTGIRLLKLPNMPLASWEFPVTAQATDDSVRTSMSGDYHMVIGRQDVQLRKPGALGVAMSWGLSQILKFKSEDMSDGTTLVTLEGSSQCGHSAGRYLFRTPHGRKIIQKVKDVLAEQEVQEKQYDRELERLRAKPLAKMASTPDLLQRRSPPRAPRRPSHPDTWTPPVTSRRPSADRAPDVPTRNSKTSETPPANSSAYLDLLSDAFQPEVDDPDIPPPPIPSHKPCPTVPEQRSSPSNTRTRKPSPPPPIPEIRGTSPGGSHASPTPARREQASPVPARKSQQSPVCARKNQPSPVLSRRSQPSPPSARRNQASPVSSRKCHTTPRPASRKSSLSPAPERRSLPEAGTARCENQPTPKSSPLIGKKKNTKLPPLPPSALDRVSPPRSSSIDIPIPPARPPRNLSRSPPPPPPPRPQHTLGSHSSPVR